MSEIVHFVMSHGLFTIVIGGLNLILAKYLLINFIVRMNGHLLDAMGGRHEKQSIYQRSILAVRQSIDSFEKREKKSGIYIKAKDKITKAGFKSEYAPIVYLLFKYVFSSITFIIIWASDFKNILNAVLAGFVIFLTTEQVVYFNKKNLNVKFKRDIYKIYKYLHNQISSGVKVTDAVKTVYLVIDDRELKEILILLAARYELTLDIDTSLEEFKARFDIHEAETLCIALKQGIATGDNQQLLEKQEEVMFNQYFNYIQAETDRCHIRSFFATVMFVSIIVVMISVPLFNDVVDAISKIFSV